MLPRRLFSQFSITPRTPMASQLVALPEVERLSPSCIRILGGNPGRFTLQGTNTYLVGTGPRRLLVDTGEGKLSWAAALRRTLAEEGATLEAALLTHWHPDHVGGVGQVRALVPGVPVYQSHVDGRHADGELDIADGQTFAVEGATLRAAHTPGHTTNHMAFVLAEEDALLAGDNVLGQGTAVFEDLATYLQSLAHMRGLAGGRLYPGHGPVVDDGPAKIAEYIAHRQQREDQVVRLLRGTDLDQAAGVSPWTARELVEVIYADVRKDLHAPAEMGLVQILNKLAADGKVVRDSQAWRWKDRSPL